jgi:hypothetical protein
MTHDECLKSSGSGWPKTLKFFVKTIFRFAKPGTKNGGR